MWGNQVRTDRGLGAGGSQAGRPVFSPEKRLKTAAVFGEQTAENSPMEQAGEVRLRFRVGW